MLMLTVVYWWWGSRTMLELQHGILQVLVRQSEWLWWDCLPLEQSVALERTGAR